MISKTPEPSAAAPRGDDARSLLSAAAVREAGQRVLRLAAADALDDWVMDASRMPDAAQFVAEVVRDRYPDLRPPLHARWRHFVVRDRDLWAELAGARHWVSPAARARAAFDLAITSVLLDAGAGPDWQFNDAATGLTTGRSEGLALASLRWFERGGLSADPQDPLRADAATLRGLDGPSVAGAFQAGPVNPLHGARGRAELLNRLGTAVAARPDLFALADTPRPGGLFDVLAARSVAGRIPAATILEVLLDGLGTIWANRPTLGGVPLGDCWPYPPLGSDATAAGFVPLHKLSQWLAYSLIEPLEAAGYRVVDIGALTGLAEYRNGGLFVDLGVLTPRDPGAFAVLHGVADPLIVGWRALTVALLDDIGPRVAASLGCTAEQFPLARVLEGGTWAAGRLIARTRRTDGGPPIRISSDGTVF